ncbi:MAG TPA: hypothetical protein VLR26_18315 [Frankiaceae bacterium]|nr:hypothetical protein [Frankiaceae bacterium]
MRFQFVSRRGLDSKGNGGADIELAQPLHGVTLQQIEENIAAQQGPNGAASTRWLAANTRFFGGAAIQGVGHCGHHAVRAAGNPVLHRRQRGLRRPPVRPGIPHQRHPGEADPASHRGHYRRDLPGSVQGHVDHPAEGQLPDPEHLRHDPLRGLRAGQEQHDRRDDHPTPFQQQVFSSPKLVPGKYDLECYIASDSTGMPHFFMGMHKVITIR